MRAIMLALFSLSLAVQAASASECVPQIITKRIPIKLGAHKITADVADTPATREKGLMCVRKLKPRYGMLFVFPMEMDLGFWMKNTLVPLDMVWIGADKRVTGIAENVKASTLDTPEELVARAGGRGLYVLELAAGTAKRYGLKKGDALVFKTKPVAR